MAHSPLYQLIEIRMGVKLDEYVPIRRSEGASWDTLSRDITSASGQVLNGETLRTWFADAEKQSAGAA